MKYSYIFVVAFVSLFITVLGFNPSYVIGWHEKLGISDEEASKLAQTNPNDPQIISWKNALTQDINRFERTCIEPSGSLDPIRKQACDDIIPPLYQSCVSHPGQVLACLDPRIRQWAGNIGLDTNNNTKVEDFSNNSTFQNYQDKNCPPERLVLCEP